ncbi:redoxin domain-containing protein [Virgibacillus siamensis]|uniref:redoxin domain-containing protein n=1 Tax=Virgibacillus siamensis TaxID=480071 RepID=UPI0009844BC4|nr:redoxin domain-containing protein [Virgibacillus siamensis]
MKRNIFGILVLVILAGVMIAGFMNSKSDETSSSGENENDSQGAGIVAPDQTGVEAGETAPDFELETLSGETFRLSDLRGKAVFLNFWASWCGPCKKEMPDMQQFHEKHKNDVEVIAVNLTGSEMGVGKVRNYIDKFGYTYPIPLDKKSKVQEMYDVTVVPTTYFIGPDGEVMESKRGPMTYDFMLDMLKKIK